MALKCHRNNHQFTRSLVPDLNRGEVFMILIIMGYILVYGSYMLVKVINVMQFGLHLIKISKMISC